MTKLHLRSLALAVILSSTAFGAIAQGTGGMITLPESDGLTLPGLPGLEAPVLAEDRSDPARRGFDTAAQQGFTNWITPLRLTDLQLRRSGSSVRVTGERSRVDFDLYISSPGAHRQLQLVTQSSIDILPERSLVRVEINGRNVGNVKLGNFEGFSPALLDLPADVLVVGRNRVVLEFVQGHRIFCGPEAAFDLWTDFDLARSGLVVDHAETAVGPESFMMALAAQSASSQPVEIRGLDRMPDLAPAWRAALVNTFNRSLLGDPVVFRFTDFWTVQESTRAFARVTVLPGPVGRVSYQTGGDGAQVMVLEIADTTRPEDLLAQIPQFAPQPAATRAPMILPEMDIPFAAFGVPTENFTQRYAHRDYPFRLPDDWLVLTAVKARINFDYAYATGLPDNSMLLLSVNGQSIRLLPLRDEGGQFISLFPIDFEARILQPGTNTLSFELMIPGDPPDLPCPVVDRPFLQIANTSTINVPYSPSMAIADMDLAFGALTPDSLRMNDLSARAWGESDVLMLKAALARSQADTRPATLHLISIDDLSSVPTSHHRADRRLLEETVLNLPSLPQASDPMALFAQADDPFARRRQTSNGIVSSLRAALSNGWTNVNDGARWVMDRIFPSSGDQLNRWLAERKGQAILFQLDADRPDEIWMLRSPDSDMHAIAHAVAGARAYGGGPRGQVSILTHEGYWDNWIAPDRRPVLLEPWSMQNFRSAMGNFVSARPIFYTLMILALALISALVALRLVVSTREHKT
ncbi:MAG: cellulose biosynthesis cyclic di-GMP-binding regulatory protein BcsB [Roseinatronobacter sp.]